MSQNDKIQLFEDERIRTAWDEKKEEWYFSVVDVVRVLTDSADPAAYWIDRAAAISASVVIEILKNS